MLSLQEKEFYERHLQIEQFGMNGQEKLKSSSIIVIGAGGLGSPVLQYLSAAGVGHIGIVEDDTIDVSNLQRQVLFDYNAVGEPKLQNAINKIKALNPFIKVTGYPNRLNENNALDILKDFDLVIDTTDNFTAKYLINDACYLLKKPLIYGSIYQFQGQISVFNTPDGPNYRDLFPSPPPAELAPNCAEAGVLGVLPAIIGSMQANEAIKYLTGLGECLIGQLAVFDALTFTLNKIRFNKRADNPLSGNQPTLKTLEPVKQICSVNSVQDISIEDFANIQENHEEFQLIDVRTALEREIYSLGGQHIPLSDIEHQKENISSAKKVVFYCKSGGRSKKAIEMLKNHPNFDNFYNLKGGADTYKHTKALNATDQS